MAAITGIKRAKVFIIYDLTDKDTAFGVLGTATIFGPQGEIFTMKEVRAQLNTALTNASADDETLVDILLTQFDAVWDKNVEITEDGDTRGPVVFSTSKTMRTIRRRLSSIIGVWVPEGGFFADHERISRVRESGPRR